MTIGSLSLSALWDIVCVYKFFSVILISKNVNLALFAAAVWLFIMIVKEIDALWISLPHALSRFSPARLCVVKN